MDGPVIGVSGGGPSVVVCDGCGFIRDSVIGVIVNEKNKQINIIIIIFIYIK